MKTLQEIKDEYAIKYKFDDFRHLIKYQIELDIVDDFIEHLSNLSVKVQQEQQNLIAENAKIEIKLTSKDSPSVVKEYGNEDGLIKVSKESIINENNIIR